MASCYDPATGVFELTATTAREWFQRPTDHKGATFMERIAGILTDEGLEVLFTSDAYMLVRARPGAIWTALSGKPSTREDHGEVTEPRRYTATYLGHIVKPQLSAQAFNKLLDAAGLVYKDGGERRLTAAGERYGEYALAAGLGFDRGEVVRTVHWDLGVLEVLGLHWPKPAGG